MIHSHPLAEAFEAASGPASPISPIEEIITEARQGRPYILVDAEDRDGEGDIAIPAGMASADQINFMATHARGLICLALTDARARQLRLPPMASERRGGRPTAFTVSIEARTGVSTGISAHDRALTISVAVDPEKGASDLVSPGHIFPVAARDGGVLSYAGRTEAAVDVARLAGLYPAAVICEILNDDGSMAKLPDLIDFARQQGLKLGSAADLATYRQRTERYVERILESAFDSARDGPFRLYVYRNALDGAEHTALVKGRIEPDCPTLVLVHSVDYLADMLGQANGQRRCAPSAFRHIAEHKRGRRRCLPQRFQHRLAFRTHPSGSRQLYE
jgi:3,4-dihydroxy 2-butanone 4-phosphate synthase / GTP cyclohydrolase II